MSFQFMETIHQFEIMNLTIVKITKSKVDVMKTDFENVTL